MHQHGFIEKEVKHFHLFCGLGGGAKGFNAGQARVGNMVAKFRCLGGIDIDPGVIRDFTRLAGVPGTVLDLFDREQYEAFHGRKPPADWREATPEDLRRAAGWERPAICFTSAPCKGFSGLLSSTKSKTDKYQALNRLTVRGIFLMLEAWADEPPELVIFENVPLLMSRGAALLKQITSMLRSYGYATAETVHDCGELMGGAQRRKRLLLVARHTGKVSPLLYQPLRKPLRGVGEILGRMPLPGELCAGPMHRVPSLQWKTWVRLAMVEAGSDWRSLNRLAVEDGYLRDYLIVPEMFRGALGVRHWNEPTGAVTGESLPLNGAHSVADPRFDQSARWNDGQAYGVHAWGDTTGAIAGQQNPGQGRYSVADPRSGHPASTHNNVYRVVRWDREAGTITSGHGPSSGGQAVADPRHLGTPKHANEFRVTQWDRSGHTVTGSHGTGQCVADPRPGWNRHGNNLVVQRWEEPSRTIIAGGKGVQGGQMSVADPRPQREGRLFTKYPVTQWDSSTGTVIGGDDCGAYAVADPRTGMKIDRDAYQTGGHFGVVPWSSTSGAVSAAACHDNGRWSVADPRLPAPTENLVAVIRAEDGCWHRPFTTLELAALQSLVTPEEAWGWTDANKLAYIQKYGDLAAEGGYWKLDGESDQAWRERIGNAVPPDAAQAIASEMGRTLLLAWSGETFELSSAPVWVRPTVAALMLANAGTAG